MSFGDGRRQSICSNDAAKNKKMNIVKQVKLIAKNDNQPIALNENGTVYFGSITLQPDEVAEYLKKLPAAVAELNRINCEELK